MALDPLQALFEDLAGIRGALQDERLEHAHALLIRHDRAVRDFMHSAEGRQAGYDALARLLREQLEVQASMTLARDDAAQQLQAARQADRASRAYLSLAGE